MERAVITLAAALWSLQAGALLAAPPPTVDLSKAVVVYLGSNADTIERNAVLMLRWELQKRTGINLRDVTDLPDANTPAIIVGSRERMPALPSGAMLPQPPMKDGKPAAEGYVLAVDTKARSAPSVYAIGNDRRGTLFAVGMLLRKLDWGDRKIAAPADLAISTAPAYPMRGMQLGYRRLADTYDKWDAGQYSQYLRDLICFGNNAIELIPCVSPNVQGESTPDLRTMPTTTWDNTLVVSTLCDSYDMDCWMWVPVWSAETPAGRANSLREREALFAACKRIDAVFVPGGDPGDTPAEILLPYLKDLAAALRRHHPKAGMWFSTQGFEPEKLEWTYQYLQKNQPDWLTGVVYGPWTKDTIQHMREAVPAKYPLRHYPDITHADGCQYPYPQWDPIWAWTYERQPIHPRPTQEAHVCNLYAKYFVGAIPYSDGTGDDVNKIVWDAMLWDPKADLREVLRDFGRVFVGPEFADGVADGLLMLEQDWSGSCVKNTQVPKTLAHYQAMEKRATPYAMASWRFQQQLIRAYGDAYVQQKAQFEAPLLEQAYAELAKAPKVGSEAAMAAAEKVLGEAFPPKAAARLAEAVAQPPTPGWEERVYPLAKAAYPRSPAAPEWRRRMDELAAMLYQSIGMQLNMEEYNGSDPDRGALLDTIDWPTNDGAWLLLEFWKIRRMQGEQEKLARLDEIVNWENPGPGGFYDDLGAGAWGKEPHLVLEPGWEKDPGFVESAQDEHGGPIFPLTRFSWAHQGQTLYWTPLRLRYTGLDPNATYIFKCVPGGRFSPTTQLYFNGVKFGEPFKTDVRNLKVMEFPVPRSATAGGVLEVKFEKLTGRGAQCAEAWLIKKP